jgi:hypothetical protein
MSLDVYVPDPSQPVHTIFFFANSASGDGEAMVLRFASSAEGI